MSRYVIYARKSTESDDRQILSIDSQIQELKTLAQRQGIAIAEVLTESRSAKSPGRPVFTQLMRRVQHGDVRGVLAWKMDRLARNHFDTGQVLQALSDGLLEKVITIDRTYTPDGNDRFIGNFELGMATKYIDDLRQNVKRGIRANRVLKNSMRPANLCQETDLRTSRTEKHQRVAFGPLSESPCSRGASQEARLSPTMVHSSGREWLFHHPAKAQRGWISHTAPLGYLNDRATKTIVKDPERFDLIRRMWDLVLSGSMRPTAVLGIATREWGLRTRTTRRTGGVPLARSAFYTLLKNPFYMGVIRRKSGEMFPGAHPSMVSREEFYRVQELLGRGARPRPQERQFSFTGLLRCGSCGAGITAEYHQKRSGREYVYYRCSRSKPGIPCREPAIPLKDLEAQLAAYLDRIVIPEAVHAWLLSRAKRRYERERGTREQVRLTLAKARREVGREQETLLSLRLRNLLTDELFMRKRQEIEERQQDLDRKMARAEQSVGEVEKQLESTFTFAAKAHALFRSGTGVQRRMIVEAVALNPTLTSRKVALDFAKPFSFLAESAGRHNWCSTIDDVWNFLMDRTEYFVLPNLEELPSDHTLPRVA